VQPWACDESYTYDPLGNRTSWQGHPESDVVHDAQDGLVQDADFFYTYDAEGQLVSKEDRGSGHTTTYDWDSFGQLVRMEHPDGAETTFAYDGLGRRVQVVDKGEVTRFGWDGDELRMVFDGANTLQRWESTDVFGELLSTYDAVTGTVDEAVRNHLGSVQEGARDSFGNPVLATTGFSSHALTWHTQDPTGLIYARARYLDPKTGRFLSEDPIVSGNRYGYALNNPLTMWDPYGLTAALERDAIARNLQAEITPSTVALGQAVSSSLAVGAAALGPIYSGAGGQAQAQAAPEHRAALAKHRTPQPFTGEAISPMKSADHLKE
jgi:RHS repeat-associated protein